MIVLVPPTDEILGAKHSRLSRTRYRQAEYFSLGSRGREDSPH